jgi:hypothetical protein
MWKMSSAMNVGDIASYATVRDGVGDNVVGDDAVGDTAVGDAAVGDDTVGDDAELVKSQTAS